MVDRLLKGNIVLILIGMFALPVVLTFLLQATGMIMITGTSIAWQQAWKDSRRGNGILTGATVGSQESREKKLQGITAYAGLTKNTMTYQQAQVIDFDDAADGENLDSVFRPIDLDLTATGDTAVIAIATRPLLWRVATSETARTVRLGVEGAAPLDIADAPKGLLAGYRIGALGVQDVAQPEHFRREQSYHRLCESIERWIAFYGHEERRRLVRITAFTNPRSIKVNAFGATSQTAPIRGLPDLEELCSDRQPPPMHSDRGPGGWRP